MSWIAAATIGGAVISGIASNSAADKAAKGQDNALAASQAGTNRARTDIMDQFGRADAMQNQAFSDTRNFLAGSLPAQIQPFQSGNIAAQEQLARGLPQIQNAILGNQIDLSGFQPQAVPIPQLALPQRQPQQGPQAPQQTAFRSPVAIGTREMGAGRAGTIFSKKGSA